MMLKAFVRAIGLVLIALAVNINTAYAHSLPGSVLTFSQQGKVLSLKLTFSLEDLVIAEKSFQALEKMSTDNILPEEEKARLVTYFQQHFGIEKASQKLPFTLKKAVLKKAYHHDLGNYMLVISHLTLPLGSDESAWPVSLNYDVVMHKIRSHRAIVYWVKSDDSLVKLANFRYKKVNGKVKSYLLSPP